MCSCTSLTCQLRLDLARAFHSTLYTICTVLLFYISTGLCGIVLHLLNINKCLHCSLIPVCPAGLSAWLHWYVDVVKKLADWCLTG